MPSVRAPDSFGFTNTTTVPLYWARYGAASAPTLLVLHGGPGADHGYLLPQMLDLADGYQVVFYDQRGGGRSRTDDRTPITWRTHVDDLAAIVREQGMDPLSIIGYSWGGLLAMLFAIEAARDPHLPAPTRLVLIDPAPVTRAYRNAFESEFARRQSTADIVALRDELGASGLRERDPEAYRHRNFELSVAGYFAVPSAARDLTPFRVVGRAQQSVWDSLGDFNLLQAGALDSVSLPALVLHGSADPIPLASSAGAAAALQARLIVIPGAGHVPYVEQPDQLFAAIREFLRKTE